MFQWHLLGRRGTFVSPLGPILLVVGWRIVFLAVLEYRFAALVVKHQGDAHDTVIETGVYGVVHYPMSAGIIPVLVGMSLWLESYVAALLALVPTGLLALRILLEEQFLKRELDGYDA